MFLATTALQDFWNEDDEILCLGSWCLRRDRIQNWDSLNTKVLPSPWDNRERFYAAADYADRVCDHLLGELGRILDREHGEKHGLRYWRILLGPWLLHYIHSAYDRYVHLQEAFRVEPGLSTLLLDPSAYTIPVDFPQSYQTLYEDLGNLQLMSEILVAMGHDFPTRLQAKLPEPTPPAARRWQESALLQDALFNALGLLSARTHTVLCDLYAQKRAWPWRIALRSGFRCLPLRVQHSWPFAPDSPDLKRRSVLSEMETRDEFERIAARLIPNALPSILLEDYAKARETTLKRLPHLPGTIVTANGLYYNETLKFLAAAGAETGRKLVTVTHGGGYGQFRYSGPERHERAIADSFFALGSGNNGAPGRFLPNPGLSELAALRRRAPKERTYAYYIGTEHPRYLYRFQPSPVGSQWDAYYAWAQRFLSALPEKTRDALITRAPKRSYGQAPRERLTAHCPSLRFDDAGPIYPWLAGAKIVVMDYLSTPIMECLAADIPMIAFWDPERFEYRPEAAKPFEALEHAGILLRSPEEAARKLAEVFDDPSAWWAQENVRKAALLFRDAYAAVSNDWAGDWARVLEEEAWAGRPA